MIEPKKGRKPFPRLASNLREATAPNQLWCADYKGQFRLGDRSICYPLTMTDQFSRYLFCCEGMPAISDEEACDASLRVFEKYGLPEAIRTDNGVPFASQGLWGLTRLSVLWLRLGIELERIEPGQPQQNGRHERMHRTLKLETTRPAMENLLQQQERFDEFQEEFNNARPHEALEMQPPNAVHRRSERALPSKLPNHEYRLHDDVLSVRANGTVRLSLISCQSYFLATALGGQEVGVREEDDGRWLVTFMNLHLGHINPKLKRFEPRRK